MQIHQSAEDYLETILMLSQRMGKVRSIDVVNELGFTKASVSIAMNKAQEGNIRIVTTNHGKTIPEEMQEHIFEQFFRMDSSRNSDTGGSGLGLAVTREIVELHGGTIRCQSRMEEIQFIIELPDGLKEN